MIRAHATRPRLPVSLQDSLQISLQRPLQVSLGASLLFLAASAAAPAHAQTVRQHPPHVHGHGALNMVLDGRELTAELTAPADDLVGFEHAPRGKAETAAVRSAVSTLDDAARILGLPAAAACVQDDADIDSPLIEGHGHGEGNAYHEEEAHEGHDDSMGHEHHEGHEGHEEHAEFHVTYRLTCAEPKALGQLAVGYFTAFARAQSLAVQAVGPWGQTAATLTREKPGLVLAATN